MAPKVTLLIHAGGCDEAMMEALWRRPDAVGDVKSAVIFCREGEEAPTARIPPGDAALRLVRKMRIHRLPAGWSGDLLSYMVGFAGGAAAFNPVDRAVKSLRTHVSALAMFLPGDKDTGADVVIMSAGLACCPGVRHVRHASDLAPRPRLTRPTKARPPSSSSSDEAP